MGPDTCCPVSIGGSLGVCVGCCFGKDANLAAAPLVRDPRESQQCTRLTQNGSERPFLPICVHSCVSTSVYNSATVYTSAPKRRREATSANLCTLLRPHGLARDHGALVYDLQAERPIDVCPLPGGAAPIASPLARASPAWSSTGYRRGPAGHRSALAPSWWEASTIKSDMKAGCKPAELPGRGPRRAGRGRPQGAGLHGAGDASRGSWTRTTRCAQRVGGLWPHPFRTPCPLCHLFAIKLAVVERCVPASCGDKLLVRALLYHVSALHVENEVRVADG